MKWACLKCHDGIEYPQIKDDENCPKCGSPMCRSMEKYEVDFLCRLYSTAGGDACSPVGDWEARTTTDTRRENE